MTKMAVVKGRRDASSRRRLSAGVSVRPRVQVDAKVAPAPTPLLQRLLAACRRAFRGPGTVPAPDDVALIRGILDKMGPEDVHLSAVTKAAADSGVQRRRRPIITRTTIHECTNFSIVVFLLPPGAVIPLHDHPGMTVFSKLLHGSLHVTSYDWAAAGADSHGRPAARLARLVLDADLRAPCGALVLFPESGGNMHRLAAATACAVLDVLGPPYSGDRDCTYYRDLPYSQHRLLARCEDDGEAAAGDDDVRAGAAAGDDEHRRRQGAGAPPSGVAAGDGQAQGAGDVRARLPRRGAVAPILATEAPAGLLTAEIDQMVQLVAQMHELQPTSNYSTCPS